MLQQPKHRDENYVAIYRPHHDQRGDRVDRVRCRPSGDRIVPPSGLPHKTQSVVILRLRQVMDSLTGVAGGDVRFTP